MLRKLTAGIVASAALMGVGAGTALAARHPHAKPATADRHSRDMNHSRDMHRLHRDMQRDR